MENETGKTENDKKPISEKRSLALLKGRTKFTKENAAFFGSLGKGLSKKRKTTAELFKLLDKELVKTLPRGSVPIEAKDNLTHYLTIRKLTAIAYRPNVDHVIVDVECTKCGGIIKHRIELDNHESEDHSLKALGMIYDRLSPKLQSLRIDVKAENEINTATEIMSNMIMKYVPAEKRRECLQEIQTALADAKGRDYGEG